MKENGLLEIIAAHRTMTGFLSLIGGNQAFKLANRLARWLLHKQIFAGRYHTGAYLIVRLRRCAHKHPFHIAVIQYCVYRCRSSHTETAFNQRQLVRAFTANVFKPYPEILQNRIKVLHGMAAYTHKCILGRIWRLQHFPVALRPPALYTPVYKVFHFFMILR